MKQLMAALRPDLTDRQAEAFETYYEMLTDWNGRMRSPCRRSAWKRLKNWDWNSWRPFK